MAIKHSKTGKDSIGSLGFFIPQREFTLLLDMRHGAG